MPLEAQTFLKAILNQSVVGIFVTENQTAAINLHGTPYHTGACSLITDKSEGDIQLVCDWFVIQASS